VLCMEKYDNFSFSVDEYSDVKREAEWKTVEMVRESAQLDMFQ
jgi:hypothetical protein